MAKIEGIRVKNFRSLKDVTLGWLPGSTQKPLNPMTIVIGKNGVGKSTLFDVFGFLSDLLKFGVDEACELRGRGGFEKIRSQGQDKTIEFTLSFSTDATPLPLIYQVTIRSDKYGRVFIGREILFDLSDSGDYVCYLMLIRGVGFLFKEKELGFSKNTEGFDYEHAIKTIEDSVDKLVLMENASFSANILEQINKNAPVKGAEVLELVDNNRLGIASLGAFKDHPKISSFVQFISGWYLSYFAPDAARTLPLSGVQQHLNSRGDNLANVVQFMEREHRDSFQNILDRIAEKIPGIDKIRTEKTSDGRLLLCFNDQGFQDPFYAPQMSDGTLKVFAYLLLREDPNPPPFICIEEPENGLYHKLLETLAAEFRAHATGRDGGSQLFITTHQPYFVDALDPEEVWVLEKGEDGFSTITRASEIPYVQKMVEEGLPLGGLWYSDYLDAR